MQNRLSRTRIMLSCEGFYEVFEEIIAFINNCEIFLKFFRFTKRNVPNPQLSKHFDTASNILIHNKPDYSLTQFHLPQLSSSNSNNTYNPASLLSPPKLPLSASPQQASSAVKIESTIFVPLY